MGIKATRGRLNVSKASPNDLLNFLIEKFQTLIDQLKEEQKARVKAEYELYELKAQQPVNSDAPEETIKKLRIAIQRKDATISVLEQKLMRANNELEGERQKSHSLEEAIKALTEGVASKDTEMTLFIKKVEELTERKNRLQKECINLREENKGLVQANASLESEMDECRKQYMKTQEEARGKVDELRNLLKKNSALIKQMNVRL